MTYSIVDVVRSHVSAMLGEVYTSLPAIVDVYYPETQTIDCTVALKTPVSTNEIVEPAGLRQVPVIFPSGSDWVLAAPLKKGDAVLLQMTMYSLDEYLGLAKNQIATPKSLRLHDINDCFAIVGVTTPKTPAVRKKFRDKLHLVQGAADNNAITMSLSEGVKIISNTSVGVEVGSTNFTITDGTVDTNANIVTTGTVTCSDLITTTVPSYVSHTHPYTDDGNPLTTGIPNP